MTENNPLYRRGTRGQSSVDFLTGMTVFLITIGFTINFIPGIFQPFEADAGAEMVTADRSAALLAESALVKSVESPGVLNETCTAAFFDAAGGTGDCEFDNDADSLNQALGIDDTLEANVTIQDDQGVLTVNGETGPVTTAAGPAPPSTADVVVAHRVILVESDQGTLYVRVW